MFRMQSKVITPLTEHLSEEVHAREKNLVSFSTELAMAGELFEAAQVVFTEFPTSNTSLRKIQAGLTAASIRYFASAVDLCLRGNAVEAESLMRTPIECMGYAIVLTEKPQLVQQWIDMDELKDSHERSRLFGTESAHRRHRLLKEAALTYDSFSVFGAHARVPLIAQTLKDDAGGWRVAHAEIGAHHVRLSFGAILFTMRDLVRLTMAPLLLDEPFPTALQEHLERFEALRTSLGPQNPEFMRWIENANVKHLYHGAIVPVRLSGVRRRRRAQP